MSRRRVLNLVAAIPALLAIIGPHRAVAQSVGALKSQYRYRNSPHGKQRCRNCSYYTAQSRVFGQCSILQTQVTWEGWCTAWRAKTN
jgi:hypothetical protein